jgi:hypothetical protein
MLSFQHTHHTTVLRAVAEAFERDGIAFDEEAWTRAAWWLRAGRTVQRIEASVPASDRFALVDGGALGVGGELRGRVAIPLPSSNDEFAGFPACDGEALAELDRLHAAGVSYVAVAWPAFWWLDEYPAFAAALRAEHAIISQDEDVLIFGPRNE